VIGGPLPDLHLLLLLHLPLVHCPAPPFCGHCSGGLCGADVDHQR
jgi:hypothetical protein